MQLNKIDTRSIPQASTEIRCFVAVRNEVQRLPCFLDHHRKLGVSRFFFADNLSNDGTTELLLEQHDCHVFSAPGNYFMENVSPPGWTNALANLFGDGHWCLTLDADELFVFPHCDVLSLQDLCRYLDARGDGAISGPMVDMYSDMPLTKMTDSIQDHFLDVCPFFDLKPGWTIAIDQCPGWQMFGGVRERVFWRDRVRGQLPPCISKVPLVKWFRGMKYLVSMHLHSGARVSDLRCALLHFKFLSGFAVVTGEQIKTNTEVTEKGLSEKAILLATLKENPGLSLLHEGSLRYQGPGSLVDTGWMRTSPEFEKFARGARESAA
jgi:hypothetical protein